MPKLDILSDPICPWCYIGKANLDRALAAHPDHPFIIEWHPFQLNPGMPPEGMDRRTYLEAKFGGKENAVKTYARIAEAAEEAGLMINFAAIERTPSTLNAHRLIHWAGIEGRQTAVVSLLFEAYFEKGLDIGDTEVLAQIAERAEMDGAVARRLLAGDADADLIAARDAHARARGVDGVPTFILANQHVLVGAQPSALWEQMINEINEIPPEGTPIQ
ncbi:MULTISPECIES: DsbA family oxidoreductase [Actibacterium]|uniref:Putative DsbA family dithiol-disulfide isomerase n=1 Tax=Actibacterium naphthalenivorans TaxID=1614693 RepID=A0A840C8B8_9RHOB|nr:MULTISPECIES: DsbA family oxidoreductase [Actibacterium]ALG90279.1 polyketide biosynthesis protein [Actibacterium sp. EMB200-NS6]MBB4022191.1 putative DsbA family dithiol-disulfide isomerase [Actibacterium naphthalenivorans]